MPKKIVVSVNGVYEYSRNTLLETRLKHQAHDISVKKRLTATQKRLTDRKCDTFTANLSQFADI